MVRRRRPKEYRRGERGRFEPSRLIEPVTRKEQPPAIGPIRVGRLEWKDYPMKPVSSTNVAMMGYMKGRTMATGRCYVDFLNGKSVVLYDFPFSLWEEFYYAHSKGTFYYYNIRQQGYDTAQRGITWNYA